MKNNNSQHGEDSLKLVWVSLWTLKHKEMQFIHWVKHPAVCTSGGAGIETTRETGAWGTSQKCHNIGQRRENQVLMEWKTFSLSWNKEVALYNFRKFSLAQLPSLHNLLLQLSEQAAHKFCILQEKERKKKKRENLYKSFLYLYSLFWCLRRSPNWSSNSNGCYWSQMPAADV